MARNSILNERHRALGSKLDGDSWNDMPIPWSYNSCVHDEVVAVRSRVGLYDVSALNLVNVSGPDAEKLLDKLVARDITKLKAGHSLLAAIVREDGSLCDDIMIIRDSAESFRISHGGGETKQQLAQLAPGLYVKIEPDLDTHILSLQGPKSLELLNSLLDFDLATLQYFHHLKTTLLGKEVYIARGGYSGELGYEIYVASKDTVLLWDEILKAGQAWDIVAASWNSLELTRIEAGLLFFPYEMPEGDTTPWEVNMGWGVDLNKAGDYVGKAAVVASHGKQRVHQVGLICKSTQPVAAGSIIVADGKEVGVVTSASYSRYLMQSLALAHVLPEYAAKGTSVEIKENDANVTAYVAPLPFYDPLRLRTHPR